MKEQTCQAGGVSDERSKRQPEKPRTVGRKGERKDLHPSRAQIDITHGVSLRLDAFVDLVGDARGAGHVRGVALGELAQGLGALLS
jgi:hypothetical protein